MITLRAVIARLNRRLAHEGSQVRTLRGTKGVADLGRFFQVDTRTGNVECPHVNPVAMARGMSLIRPRDVVEGEVVR